MIVPPIMPPPAPKTTVQRFRKQGFYMVCDLCGLTIDYCKGHALPEAGAGDGSAESDLAKRIREARQNQGGR
jgi:hypothetical protein